MTVFVCDKLLVTGIEVIDDQHRKIVDHMTKIHNELSCSHYKCDNFEELFDNLELLCLRHFMEEELLIDEKNYPSATEHEQLHDLYLKKLDRFMVDNKDCHTSSTLKEFANIIDDFITNMHKDRMILGEFNKTSF